MRRVPLKPKAARNYVKPERRYPEVPVNPPKPRAVMVAANDSVVPVPKGIKAKPGKRAPNEIEKRWIRTALEFGCVACWLDGVPSRPTAFHHIVQGTRRLGHLYGFGLCDPGHHQNGSSLGLVSRHPNKAAFEKRYGTEFELLALVKKETGVYTEASYA